MYGYKTRERQHIDDGHDGDGDGDDDGISIVFSQSEFVSTIYQ